MKREYDISKKSDMRRFKRDMTAIAQQKITDALANQTLTFRTRCPHCAAEVEFRPAPFMCPVCGGLISPVNSE